MSRADVLRDYRQLARYLNDSVGGVARLARGLPEFFRERVTVARAQEEIKRALENRAENFLELARTQIYGRPASPYLRLLKTAGCEFSDLRVNVCRYGLERTLEQLAGEGVYFTSDEFKGKKEVLRKGQSFRVSPAEFKRRDSSPGFVVQSGGTSGQPVDSLVSLDWLAIGACSTGVFFFAHNLFAYSHAMYDAILPGGGGINNLLMHARLGIRTDRWFARKVPTGSRLGALYHRLDTYLIVLSGKCFGPGFPMPEFIDLGDVRRIVRWISEKKNDGKFCCITTPASNAVRIAGRTMG